MFTNSILYKPSSSMLSDVLGQISIINILWNLICPINNNRMMLCIFKIENQREDLLRLDTDHWSFQQIETIVTIRIQGKFDNVFRPQKEPLLSINTL